MAGPLARPRSAVRDADEQELATLALVGEVGAGAGRCRRPGGFRPTGAGLDVDQERARPKAADASTMPLDSQAPQVAGRRGGIDIGRALVGDWSTLSATEATPVARLYCHSARSSRPDRWTDRELLARARVLGDNSALAVDSMLSGWWISVRRLDRRVVALDEDRQRGHLLRVVGSRTIFQTRPFVERPNGCEAPGASRGPSRRRRPRSTCPAACRRRCPRPGRSRRRRSRLRPVLEDPLRPVDADAVRVALPGPVVGGRERTTELGRDVGGHQLGAVGLDAGGDEARDLDELP